ncbi:hypothetical protein GCM10023142_16890 [Anaerocolumna aminovalerica]|jgi:hypothetical protein|uniref:Uncharacterized protein n=1 Tax=Anaerocolumna aminovalerica TaxID=1527 RepID=A0A1I5C725_9FIRM|nr:hypothetical protein [Anaerocolumna aminovalerica]MBU5333137.1 hypothetical protein [Anaerocolumna aminovalerica]MDU6263291.1 hypothetical protein [Anaerocolumna aminovalerica]SFN82656.1 hypothetical protein SAMN04489757_102170 [Anaerocolumna aminovalerica]
MSENLNDEKNKKNKSCVNPIESCLLSLPPKQFTLLSTIFGLILLDDLSINQKNALGNFIVSVGQTMLTAAAQEQSLQSDSENDQICEDIDDLKKQITLLKKELNSRK